MTDTESNRSAGEGLLTKYNPILVMFPERGEERSRPGQASGGPRGWGDYQPISIQEFIDRTTKRKRRNFLTLPFVRLLELFGWHAEQPTIEEIQRQPCKWELDLTRVRSTDAETAWTRTLAMQPTQRCVYGRAQYESKTHVYLEYWYLYPYNEFDDLHEGDWEVVVVHLERTADGQDWTPRMVAASNHLRPLLAEWSIIRRDGDRPIIYVARGSHAGYFAFEEFRDSGTIMPPLGGRLWRPFTITGRWLRRLRRSNYDFLPCDPQSPEAGRVPQRFHGERVGLNLELIDSTDADWKGIRVWWGSTRSLSKGPSSPWDPCLSWATLFLRLARYERDRWFRPWQWIRYGVWWTPTRTSPAGDMKYW